jgi:hypothetical protein
MGDPDKAVFISYRQKLSPFVARPIFENLTSHGYDVFMDVESIDSGASEPSSLMRSRHERIFCQCFRA